MLYLGAQTNNKDVSTIDKDLHPDTATAAMTQSVGVDSNGKLWTAPGGGFNLELIRSITLESEATAIEISTDADGNEFELTCAQLFIYAVGTTSNAGNGSVRLRTNVNSSAGGGKGQQMNNLLRNASTGIKDMLYTFICGQGISGYGYNDVAGTVIGHYNDSDSLKKIFLAGTTSGSSTFGVGSKVELYGIRK